MPKVWNHQSTSFQSYAYLLPPCDASMKTYVGFRLPLFLKLRIIPSLSLTVFSRVFTLSWIFVFYWLHIS